MSFSDINISRPPLLYEHEVHTLRKLCTAISDTTDGWMVKRLSVVEAHQKSVSTISPLKALLRSPIFYRHVVELERSIRLHRHQLPGVHEYDAASIVPKYDWPVVASWLIAAGQDPAHHIHVSKLNHRSVETLVSEIMGFLDLVATLLDDQTASNLSQPLLFTPSSCIAVLPLVQVMLVVDHSPFTDYRDQLLVLLSSLGTRMRRKGWYPEASAVDCTAVAVFDVTGQMVKRLGSQIGVGGYSAVYLAEWRPQNRTLANECVVVKMLHGVTSPVVELCQVANVDRMKRRFLRETMVHCRIPQHQNVIQLLGFAAFDTDIGLVLPYYSNGNVLEHLHMTPEADRKALCQDIVLGVRHLHTLGEPIVHGDLKPENVLVHHDGHAVLCDFGLSRVATSHDGARVSSASTSITAFTSLNGGGTLRYMARELVVECLYPTRESDVYALACTCAEILTNCCPFADILPSASNTVASLLDALYDCVPPYDFRSLVAAHPWFAIFRGCWEPKPLERPTVIYICERIGW